MIEILWSIYVGIIGLLFGSFFNVVGLRIPAGESIVSPGSHCPTCQHQLQWFELFPVFSFLFLKGKCRKCASSISPLYPLMEACTGILFFLSFLVYGFTPASLFAVLFFSFLIIITISDLAYMIIPNRILLMFATIFILLRFIFPTTPWWDAYVGAVAGFVLLFFIAIATRGSMGGGDIKLYFVIGLVLGIRNTIFSFFLAAFFGAIFGVMQIIIGVYKKRKPIPFGPFISLACVVSYFFADKMIDWYLNLLWSE